MSKKDDTKDLTNIKFQTMLDPKNFKNDSNQNITEIDTLLNTEMTTHKQEQWTKLDKTDKMKRIDYYIQNSLKEKLKLSDEEAENIRKYLMSCIDCKRLKNCDIVYDRIKGEITNIPNLVPNKQRRFTIKREKKTSTLKSLAPKKNRQTKRKSPKSSKPTIDVK